MWIKTAHRKLKEMAGDKYCVTEYRVTTYKSGNSEMLRQVYIEGYDHCRATDFKTALAQMKAQIKEGREDGK